MNFDIGSLNLTAEPETIAPDEYVAPAGINEPIPAGTYDAVLVDGKFKNGTNSVPVRFGKVTSRADNKTYLSAEFAIKIMKEGKAKGRIVYGKVTAIPEELIFNEVQPGREKANGFLDLIMAARYDKPVEGNQGYVDALLELVESEAEVKANVDWDVYCNPKSADYAGCGFSLRGQKNFPLDSSGQPSPRVVCSGTHAAGDAPTLLARNTVKRVYPVRR